MNLCLHKITVYVPVQFSHPVLYKKVTITPFMSDSVQCTMDWYGPQQCEEVNTPAWS